jgi:hypothetical protein
MNEPMQIIQLIFSGVALPLLGWLLREVYGLSKAMSAMGAQDQAHDREIVDLRARVVACEARVAELQVAVARCEALAGRKGV